MQYLGLNRMGLAMALSLASGASFYPVLRLGRRTRAALLTLLLAAIFLSPLLVPGRAPFLRFLAALMAIAVGCSVYDMSFAVQSAIRLPLWQFLGCLPNPFVLVLRKVLAERKPPAREDVIQFMTGTIAGTLAAAAFAGTFLIDWRHFPFVIEHAAKIVSLFLMIQFLPNGLAAGYRLAGLPATNFARNFFLAPTPAEFWRRYNRPAEQFFHEYVFKPAGGLKRPIAAMFATFVFSGIVHEYVFDIAAGRILGYQMIFFLIQGIASIATLRIRPKGWTRLPWIALTFTFNLATARLFFASLNALVPFYAPR